MTEQQSMFPEDAPDFDLDQYFTPPALALEFRDWAFDGHPPICESTILEPAAGRGSLIERVGGAKAVTAIEMDPRNIPHLKTRTGWSLTHWASWPPWLMS